MSKQELIIELVYKFRFLNRVQIQKILNHKGPRRINAWLKELVNLNYLGRIYSHKLLENTKPAIYYLSSQGIKYIRQKHDLDLEDVKKFYEDKNASQKFIDHCINVVEIIVQLREIEKNLKTHSYKITSKTETYLNEYLREIKPDLYIESNKQLKKNENVIGRFFLDIIDSHVPRYAIRYRVKQYIDFHDGYEWKEFAPNQKYPVVILILPNQQKLNHIKKHIQKVLNETFYVEDMAFLLTTIDKILTLGLSEIEKQKLWVVVKDESLK